MCDIIPWLSGYILVSQSGNFRVSDHLCQQLSMMTDKPRNNPRPTVQQETLEQDLGCNSRKHSRKHCTMLDSRGMDSPRPQYSLGPCRLTSAPRAQTTKTRFSPLQNHPPSSSLFFKGPLEQRALPIGPHIGATGSERTTISSAHCSLNAVHVGKSPQPASPRAKIARISPINSQQYSMSFSS
jgi:hypothetical protein